MAIWQDLVAESGFSGGYQTVKRFVRKLHGNQQPRQRAVIFTAPGEEARVDYGSGPMVRILRISPGSKEWHPAPDPPIQGPFGRAVLGY